MCVIKVTYPVSWHIFSNICGLIPLCTQRFLVVEETAQKLHATNKHNNQDIHLMV